eukprot:CAMPEP_0197884508 /NCGR_PEP_ID=MMETSP1439-20131203/10933_1 /TAXON_ID=66791 /ORGANISM="Gonyaulax spinifera, Strain CCMP409" /LENGTH=146 /DNA_ID=CAMNT_0043504241 /DNA_START=92 /DNA_END=529 /DNA_ORIENTATION=+
MAKGAKSGRKVQEPVTRDYTIHMHKHVHCVQFKRRAPKAIRAIRQFAMKVMFTKDVRIDTKLNKFVWSNGIRHVPRRIRLRMSRKRNEDEDAKEKMFTLVQHVPVESFKELQTEVVRDDEEGREMAADGRACMELARPRSEKEHVR